tara:strand:- start:138 stop:686 length:549 start_codon:yes stop_codon:yes gene_type:complete
MNYETHDLNFIKNDHVNFINDCQDAKERFDIFFPQTSSTWGYSKYNIFNLTSGSKRFYKLYYEIKKIARAFLNTQEPLWMQSWINYHMMNEVLDWHDHSSCSAHGYVSINPMKTKTVFQDFEIVNEIGKLYIGEPYVQHKVVILEDYYEPRITIAFDILNETNYMELNDKFEKNINLSHIPL